MKLNRPIIYIILFALAILLFNIFSYRTGFVDSAEYINVAKSLAGLMNTNVFIMHSIVYSLFLAIFLKIFPYLLTLKLLNASWLVLDAILLYKITSNNNALLIWIFSPIVYYSSTWVNQFMPISFLFLLSYYYLKKYEADNKIFHLAISALSLGLIISIRAQMIIILSIFLLIFLYNKPLKTTIYYILFTIPTASILLLVDYYYFNMPFYTSLSFVGSVLLDQTRKSFFGYPEWMLFPFIISPLTFLLYKLNFKQYKREIIFLILFVATMFVIQLRFFLAVAPFVAYLLSSIMTKKQLITNTLISIVLISVITYPYFLQDTEEQRVIQDLNAIKAEINPAVAVVTNGGAYSFPALPTSYWNEPGPRYIWSRDLELYLKGNPEYRNVELNSNPRLDADKIVKISFSASSNKDPLLTDDFLATNPYFILNKKEHRYNPGTKTLTILWRGELDIPQVNLVKCYQELCVFRKI